MAKIVLILALIVAVFCNGNTVNAVTSKDTKYICSLPVETGPCRAFIIRYGFNSSSKQCESFTYGGCKGNANNFETVEDCEATCHGKQ